MPPRPRKVRSCGHEVEIFFDPRISTPADEIHRLIAELEECTHPIGAPGNDPQREAIRSEVDRWFRGEGIAPPLPASDDMPVFSMEEFRQVVEDLKNQPPPTYYCWLCYKTGFAFMDDVMEHMMSGECPRTAAAVRRERERQSAQ